MQFNVSSFLSEPTGAIREYEIDDDVVTDGVSRHLTGDLRLDRTSRGILVRACLAGSLEAECSRCLKPLVAEVSLSIEEEFIPTLDVHTGEHLTLEEGDADAYRINERHILDLTIPVQQYWALSLPMAAVCSESCAGLCPVCGAEIGAEGHLCSVEQVDARWSKLAELKLR